MAVLIASPGAKASSRRIDAAALMHGEDAFGGPVATLARCAGAAVIHAACGIIAMRAPVAPNGMPMRRKPADFDEAFFERYYGDPATRVADSADAERIAGLIAGVVRYLELPVRRILDAGCGVGMLREPLCAQFPKARYEGLEYSAYLCRRHGWIEGSLAEHVPKAPYDLVVCHDVLQYLDDDSAARAIRNLARLSRGALYLSVLTRRDWAHAADQSRTDRTVHLRTADWYRRRLRRFFRHVGGGVHIARTLEPILWELEQPWH